MSFPHITPELARRVEQAEAAYFAAWANAWKSVRHTADHQDFAGALAVVHDETARSTYNRVMAINAHTAALLDEIIPWYAAHNRVPRFDITPADAPPSLLLALADRGYTQTRFDSAWVSLPTRDTPRSDSYCWPIEAANFAPAARLYADVRAGPTESQEMLFDGMMDLLRGERFKLYGIWDGKLVALGGMFVSDGVAHLAADSTHPEHRGQGYQTTLLSARFDQAEILGCDVVAANTPFGSPSLR
ncbi:MAG: GNAT family N-acetyltransferase, partial [Chloroflexi bacterium]|nr:GNAT family N-acetyltransferase [Chloroflexota bacterium]